MEENTLVYISKEIDPGAFFVISDVSEVRGGNFKKRDIHSELSSSFYSQFCLYTVTITFVLCHTCKLVMDI